MKTVGLLRKLRHRGGRLVDWIVSFTAAAYNLMRWRTPRDDRTREAIDAPARPGPSVIQRDHRVRSLCSSAPR